jgi:hypothetical protein
MRLATQGKRKGAAWPLDLFCYDCGYALCQLLFLSSSMMIGNIGTNRIANQIMDCMSDPFDDGTTASELVFVLGKLHHPTIAVDTNEQGRGHDAGKGEQGQCCD